METRKEHWEKVYATKQPHEVSWTQELPQTSLDFIHSFHLPKTAGIIDIGGGDSKLVDFLLEEGFENITVLDISEKAIEKAKQLGAHKIILYSNTVLKPAISLYRKLGFKEVTVDAVYERSDIKMELIL